VSHTEHQDRQVDEGLERGGRAIHSVTEPAEAFAPAGGALNDIALSSQRAVLGIQLAGHLLGWDAGPSWDQWSKTSLPHEAAKAQAVVALVGQQGRRGHLRRVRQDAIQDPRRPVDTVDTGDSEKTECSVVVIAGRDADGEWGTGAID
jgi:hypothetical protein